MIDIRTGKQMTRCGFLRGILASGIAPSITLGAIADAGSANASVGGMMRNIGSRQAVMFGKSLPYDAEVEWLIGGSINTDVSVVSTGLEIEFGNMFTRTGSWQYVLASKPITQGRWFIFGGVETWPNRQIHVGSKVLTSGIGTVETNVFYQVKGVVNSGVLSVYVDGALTGSLSGVVNLNDEHIFFPESPSNKIYYLKISLNGNMIIDLIPVRVGNAGYMYNRANPTGGPLCNGLYPSVNTGSFTPGPDKI